MTKLGELLQGKREGFDEELGGLRKDLEENGGDGTYALW